MREAGIKEGLPAEAIGCMTTATIEGTEALMKHKQTAVILATGGIGLVRAAYSSGKPAFGVGPGNVPVFIERSADVPKAVQDILTGKCFDNGTICASEQAIVVDAPIELAVREQFKLQGGYFISQSEADQLARIVATPQRSLNSAIVGKSVVLTLDKVKEEREQTIDFEIAKLILEHHFPAADDKTGHVGESTIAAPGVPMKLTTVGTERRRSLALVLHETAKPFATPASDWTPKGLCTP